MISCTLKKRGSLVSAGGTVVEFEAHAEFSFIGKQERLAIVKHAGHGLFIVRRCDFEKLFYWVIEKEVAA